MEPEVVKVKEGIRWRQHYEMKLRASGKKRPGCGLPKLKQERLMLSRRNGRCKVCKGPILIGDWIYWAPNTGKARHAPSGYKEEPAI